MRATRRRQNKRSRKAQRGGRGINTSNLERVIENYPFENVKKLQSLQRIFAQGVYNNTNYNNQGHRFRTQGTEIQTRLDALKNINNILHHFAIITPSYSQPLGGLRQRIRDIDTQVYNPQTTQMLLDELNKISINMMAAASDRTKSKGRVLQAIYQTIQTSPLP